MTATETTTDPFEIPGPPCKTYRIHGCHRLHPTYRSWAACTWPCAAWISGEGAYAVISRCRAGAQTVTLHRDVYRAQAALAALDRSFCGGVCRGAHDLVQIVLH